MKEIRDMIKYLDYIDGLAVRLPPNQKKELRRIFSVLMTLLVAFKKGTNLGSVQLPWQ